MGNIVKFYNGDLNTQDGYSLDDIMAFDEDKLESEHTYIQWLFPLREASKAVPDSPVAEDSDINAFTKNILTAKGESLPYRNKMMKAFEKMLDFYGLEIKRHDDGQCIEYIIAKNEETFPEKSKRWITPRNHNYLRLTRIMSSLKLFGVPHYPEKLHQCLSSIYEENKGTIGPLTKLFWDEALTVTPEL